MTPNEWLERILTDCRGEIAAGKHSSPTVPCAFHVFRVIGQAIDAEREACAALVEERAQYYPTDVFIPPAPGEHGRTIDGCSAQAIRCVLPGIAHDIRARAKEGR